MAAFCLGSQLAQRTQADKPELGETLPLWTIYGSSLSLSRSSHRISLAVLSVFFPAGFATSKPAHGMCFGCMLAKVTAGSLDRHSHRRCSFLSFSFFQIPTQPPPPQAPPPSSNPPPLHLSMTGQTWALRISTLREDSLIITNNLRGCKYDQCYVYHKKSFVTG